MDQAIEEAQDIYKEDIMKSIRKVFEGQDDLDPHSACYKAQIFSGASKAALEINKKASLAIIALKCLLKKNKIDYLKVKNDDDFKIVWRRKIKKLCNMTQEDVTCDPKAKYRTFDGTCNNLERPLLGSALMPQRRWLSPKYDDCYFSSYETNQSVGGSKTGEFREKTPGTPVIFSEFGAAINCCGKIGTVDDRPECIPIPIPQNDPYFHKFGRRCMNCVRSLAATDNSGLELQRQQLNMITSFIDASSIYGPSTAEAKVLRTENGDGELQRQQLNMITSFINASSIYGPSTAEAEVLRTENGDGELQRQQLNMITSYIDASSIYGPSTAEAEVLRTENGDGALLRTGDNNLLPEGPSTISNLQSKKDNSLKTGEGRVNEAPSLSALHTLFMREHNRIATILGNLNNHWSREKVFQETRKIIIAFVQHITYDEYLPAVLSDKTMQDYELASKQTGYADVYNSSVDPTVMNVFSTAAFRFGHSQVVEYQARFSQKRDIQDTFMDPNMVHTNVNGLVLWLIGDQTSLVDRFFVKGVRNHLFENKPGDGLDLIAINIQRGRDHGLPGYNDWRVKCKLGRAKSFKDLKTTHRRKSWKSLKKAYKHVDDIDLYAGAMSEKHLKGSFLGPTFTCIMVEQFRNLKFGDRFWYETSDKNIGFTPDQLAEIRKVTLSKIICDNMDVNEIQPDCFRVPNNGSNRRIPCEDLPEVDLTKWKEYYY